MARPIHPVRVLVLALTLLASGTFGAAPADWSKIPTRTLKLLYPGQSSYQWLLSKDHGDAGEEVADGEACVVCHEGEEAEIGDRLVSGGRLEPRPIASKQGTIDLALQIAYDDENAYFRFRWKTRNDRPGEAHSFNRFDGKTWQRFGYPRLHELVRRGEHPAIYEDRLSMLIDDGSVPNFDAHGCWLTCHDGMRDMPGEPSPDAVRAHALLGSAGLRKRDVRKYLPSTRTSADWASTKSRTELDRIMARGGFLDLVQWRGHRSNPVGMADDSYVLEYRRMDAGTGPFRNNWDASAQRPRFMYDPEKAGRRSTRVDRIRAQSTALVRERNAAPFDALRRWEIGDLIPAYVTSRSDAHGSAADNRHATGTWTQGMWTVVWARPLHLSHSDDKTIAPGRAYTFAFAVHDDDIGTRGHHTSWPLTVGFGAPAELAATKVP